MTAARTNTFLQTQIIIILITTIRLDLDQNVNA